MSNGLNSKERTKLAKEMAASAAAAPADWSIVPELIEFKHTIPGDGERRRTRTVGFDDLVAEYEGLKAEMEIREKRLKDIKEVLEPVVMGLDKAQVLCRGWRLGIIQKAGTKKVVPEKLMAMGVPIETIVACTEVGKPSVYLDIRKLKEKE